MEPATLLPLLLGLAVLLPLASFWLIFCFGNWMGKEGQHAPLVACGAIVGAFVLSMASLVTWLGHHWPEPHHGESHAAAEHHNNHDGDHKKEHDHKKKHDHHQDGDKDPHKKDQDHKKGDQGEQGAEGATGQVHDHSEHDTHDEHHDDHVHPAVYSGVWYTLGQFSGLTITIGYYIDALTVCMFCMVTLIASCIHFYAIGYMHEELHPVTDHEVTLEDGAHLHRPGRFHRFFQYLSLFCFSMLGLVISGNVAQTFVFWELVGICSYFLIGFYVERKSASTAANKAFIVNRVGDFGMIIGLMTIAAGLGTFSFADEVMTLDDGTEITRPGVFSQVRSPENDYAIVTRHETADGSIAELHTPDGLVRLAAQDKVAEVVRSLPPGSSDEELEAAVAAEVPNWRYVNEKGEGGYGYWLLIIAGLGIFCGCVGKSAQFPLHTWLPDAMEGPTPVSALVHSATMVAAGVFLVARFYPVFTPEVLLVIAVCGTITLFMAATIAITATDIKRVLAYSTISQLGYMMLALGVGGWVAGVLHLFTHAFFKSLMFMCSGSVIHAVHTNEMPEMGGLRKKMPITAYTMLIGCLAIAGIGIPLVGTPLAIGLSGFYSKDAILEQAFLFAQLNQGWRVVFFVAAAGGAAITAFYMFRMWYLTFAGTPRNEDKYNHAHESPWVMTVPLIVLSVFAVTVAWTPFNPVAMESSDLSLVNLLESARPVGTLLHGGDPDHPEERAAMGLLTTAVWPNEHDSHAFHIKLPVTLIAFATAVGGILLATVFYGWRYLSPGDVAAQFGVVYRFLVNKWWFDELYDWVFVKPCHFVSSLISALDRRWIDAFIDGLAIGVKSFSKGWEKVCDQTLVDGFVNRLASTTYSVGVALRQAQTGRLREYIVFIVVGTVAIFVLIIFGVLGDVMANSR